MNTRLITVLRQQRPLTNDLRCLLKTYSTITEQIIIPKRIERGPTDILRALAQTVPIDPTAPHYKYHDDPFLIPYSNQTKRSYALSQEAGRKAAHWIRQEHADLFNHKVAEPPIEVFSPKPIFDENSDVCEADLNKAISNTWTSDAISIYKLLMKKGIEVSPDMKQSLLELVCYYNGQDTLHQAWIEERWFRSGNKMKDAPKKTWKDGQFADELFHSMKPADSKSYSAIICGMCQFGQLDTAWELYQESKQKNISLNVTTFNLLISRVNFMRQSHEFMWQLVEELLNSMNQRGLKPNLGTLNAVLESLSIMHTYRKSKSLALGVVAEFKQLGINPSLASYYHLLNIFYSERNSNSGLLIDILKHIDGKEFHAVDLKDNMFFMRAMEICRTHLRDSGIAKQVDRLLHKGDNYNLIGDAFRESNYYRFFFFLLSEVEPLDDFMNIYEKMVPHIYIPEPSVMLEILGAVDMNAAWHYLPKLWADMVSFDHSERDNLLEKMLDCCSKNMEKSSSDQMVSIAWDIWEKIEDQKRERNTIEWTGKMLSNLMKICIQNGDKKKARLVFNKLEKSQNTIIGEPDVLALQLFLDSCIEDGLIGVAIKCIHYCQEIGFLETEDMARKLNSSCSLSAQQLETLHSIVGEETLKKPSKN